MSYLCITKMRYFTGFLKTPNETTHFSKSKSPVTGFKGENSCSLETSISLSNSAMSCFFLCMTAVYFHPSALILPQRYSGLVATVKLKMLPRSGMLSTEIVPLCASMICLQMARPKPVPPGEFRERSLSTR